MFEIRISLFQPTGRLKGFPMKDMMVHLEKLRKDAAECELIRDLAIDKTKRELFDKLAAHLKMLASDVERAIAAAHPPDTF